MILQDYINELLKIKNNKKILPFLVNEMPGQEKFGKPYFEYCCDPICDEFPDETFSLDNGLANEGLNEFMFNYVTVSENNGDKEVIQFNNATINALLAAGITPIIEFSIDEDKPSEPPFPMVYYDMGDFIAN